jgi:hypothetical protein
MALTQFEYFPILLFKFHFQVQFVSLSIDLLQGQRPLGYRNSQTINLYIQIYSFHNKISFYATNIMSKQQKESLR